MRHWINTKQLYTDCLISEVEMTWFNRNSALYGHQIKMNMSTNHALILFGSEKWISTTVRLILRYTYTHPPSCGQKHIGCSIACGETSWISAVTSLKCLSEGFLRGAGPGQCLYWHLHTSPHKPVWFGHQALAKGGTWASRGDSQDMAK